MITEVPAVQRAAVTSGFEVSGGARSNGRRLQCVLSGAAWLLVARSHRGRAIGEHSRSHSRVLGRGPAASLCLEIAGSIAERSEEHTSELQSLRHLVCRL